MLCHTRDSGLYPNDTGDHQRVSGRCMVYQTCISGTGCSGGGWFGDERWRYVRRMLGEWSQKQNGGDSVRFHGLFENSAGAWLDGVRGRADNSMPLAWVVKWRGCILAVRAPWKRGSSSCSVLDMSNGKDL